jgi:uncharacterized protein
VRWAAVGVVLVAVAVLAVAASDPQALGFTRGAVIAVAVLGVAAIAAAFVPVVQQRAAASLSGQDDLRRLVADECYGVVRGILPRVSDAADPLLMGVHPSAAAPGNPGDRLPSYVARDADAQLRPAVRDGGFVLVVGDSAAGKTRSAYEAVRDELTGHRLLIPRRAGSLQALARAGFRFPGELVVWLNDLDRYLGGDGLDRLLLDRLLRGGRHVLVLGTLRQSVYGAYLLGESGGTISSDFWGPVREVLEAAGSLVRLGSFGPAELRRAEGSGDSRVRKAAGRARDGSVTAYLADGPALVEVWQASWARRPVATALVAAAVDLRRAGLTEPVSRDTLARLYPHYLTARRIDPPADDQPAVAQALMWACDPHDRAVGLLSSRDRGERYDVFDYLVDHLQRDSAAPPIPEPAWQACLEHADQSGLMQVAFTAFAMRRPEITETALQKSAGKGYPSAMNALGIVLHRERRITEAETWYRAAAEQGDPGAMTNLGALLAEQNRIPEAEDWYQQAIRQGEDLAAMFNLSVLREQAGDEAQAESWYLRAAEGLDPGDRHSARIGSQDDADTSVGQPMHTAATMAMTALGDLYQRQGRHDAALSWYTRAAELDDPDAMTSLAALLQSQEQPEQAAEWRQRAANRGQRPRYE